MSKTDTGAFIGYTFEVAAYFVLFLVTAGLMFVFGYSIDPGTVTGFAVGGAAAGVVVFLGSFAMLYKIIRDAVSDAQPQ